jgi:hypothetical protein
MSTWARNSYAVLAVVATLVQVASWVWPTSRDWVDGHGLVFAGTTCLLLIALVHVVRRQPRPATADDFVWPEVAQGAARRTGKRLSAVDSARLDRLVQIVPPRGLTTPFPYYKIEDLRERLERLLDGEPDATTEWSSEDLRNAYDGMLAAAGRLLPELDEILERRMVSDQLSEEVLRFRRVNLGFWELARGYGYQPYARNPNRVV